MVSKSGTETGISCKPFREHTRAFHVRGAPRAPAYDEEIAKELAGCLAGIAEPERAAHCARGRALELAAAIDHALALCEWVSASSAPAG